MRVRLSYSVELDEVPHTVADLIQDGQQAVGSINANIESVVNRLIDEAPNVLNIINQIDRTRQQLGALDARLTECESMLLGYHKAMYESAHPDAPLKENSEE
jgi:hypothetical protein